jgi:hypothetical protein
MADVTMAYAVPASNVVVHVGDVRAANDSIVTANPQWWVALTDSDMSDGKHQNHT